jgi:hypothetical protein
MTMGIDRSVIGGLYRTRACALRLEMIGSYGIKCYPLEYESSTVSYNLVTSKDPCWSSFLFSSGRGGSRSTDGRPKILYN